MEWHSFRKRKLPLFNPPVYYFTLFNRKTVGIDLVSVFVIENEWYHQFSVKKQHQRVEDFFLKKVLKNRNFIKETLKKSEKISNDFLRFCRGQFSKNLNKLTNKGLTNLSEKYYDFYERFSLVNVPPWFFLSDKFSFYLQEKVRKFAKNDVNNIFTILATPNELTYIKKEELDVLNLAILIKTKRIKDFKKIKEFQKIIKNYFWVPFDYLGPDLWNENYYIAKIKGLLKQKIETLKQQKEEILNYQKELNKKQENLIKKLNLPKDLANLFETMKEIAKLQDDKKAITTESHYYLQQFFREIAKRTKMDYSDFYFLLREEIKNMLLKSTNMKEVVRQRKKLSIAIVEKRKVGVLNGNKAREYAKRNNFLLPSEEIEEKVKEIKGVAASPGKVRGIVKVLLFAKEMPKIKKGDILVAAMTTPNYVPAMKKSAAIITDEGGITCHAAIVSRELGIPCIIGTKVATKVLSDGDWVEVDAEKGVVRRLK